jgi:hypothetical protein
MSCRQRPLNWQRWSRLWLRRMWQCVILGGDGAGYGSVLERGERVRLISPSPALSSSNSYLRFAAFAAFRVLFAGGGVGVGVENAVADEVCVGVGGGGGVGEAGSSG